VDRLKAHNGLSPVSPAETASCGRPPRMPAAPSIQPTFMKMQTGGGGAPVEDCIVCSPETTFG